MKKSHEQRVWQVFRLLTFGQVRLTDREGHTIPFPEKALLTITYLHSRRLSRISRVKLARLLWGDRTDTHVLANLRQLLSRVKTRQQELGTVFLDFTDTEVRLISDDISVESTELDKLAAANADSPARRLGVLLEYLKGDFLSGIGIPSDRVQFWIEAERERYLTDVAGCTRALVEGPDTTRHERLVKEAAYRLLEFDSHSEFACQTLVKTLAHHGQVSQARHVLSRYRDRLRNDLDAAAAEKTLEMTGTHFRPEPVPLSQRTGLEDSAEPALEALFPERVRFPRLLLVPPAGLTHTDEDGALVSAFLEDMTIALCGVKTVKIVAPQTARKISEQGKASMDFLRRKEITYLLETRLSARKDSFQLIAELVDVGREELLWTDRFELSPDKMPRSYYVFITRTVGTITEHVEANELLRIDEATQPNAYQHYLMGLRHLRKIDLPDVRRARKLFRASLRDAPDFAGALSGMARTEHLEWLLTAWGEPELLRSAESNALKAILMDGNDASGYRELGVIKLFQGAFDESIDAFEGAEMTSPWHADLLVDYADTLVHASEPERALAKLDLAIELNPYCPDIYWWTAAGVNYFLEQFETALFCIGNMRDKDAATRIEAACWGMLGDTSKANSLVRKAMSIYPNFDIEKWLEIMPVREPWQKDQYREGLKRAGFR